MLEKEISEFLSSLLRSSISINSANKISGFFHIVNDLERMGDHCTLLILLARKKYEKKIIFTDDMFKELNKISQLVNKFIILINNNLNYNPDRYMFETAVLLENEINKQRDVIKKTHTKLLRKGKENVSSGLILMDMVSNLERIGDHSFNIAEALIGKK